MWRLFLLFLAAGPLLALVMVGAGCVDTHHGVDSMGDDSPRILSVTPSDGATGVDLNPSIRLSFSVPMDTASVRRAMHLSFGTAMDEWMDTLSHHTRIGGMIGADMDDMMTWMESVHSAASLRWNSALDGCELIPDAQLARGNEYMLVMYGPVRSSSGAMMDMAQMSSRTYITHFTTGP